MAAAGVKELIKRLPIVGPLARRIYRLLRGDREAPRPFPGSERYWEQRYVSGGDSGPGSYGKFALFKAEILNDFVAEHEVRSVIEFGCGDGNQLELAAYPVYLGVDVSETAIARCRERFRADPTKTFQLAKDYEGRRAELALSLDVIFHLVEDGVFERYMGALFQAATRFVIIYSSNRDEPTDGESMHVRHRRFTSWIDDHAPGWTLMAQAPNRYPNQGDYRTGSFSDFFIYRRIGGPTPGSDRTA
jgi:SAM-dependent methyltransferase